MLSAMIEMETTTVSVPVATAGMEHFVKVRPLLQGDKVATIMKESMRVRKLMKCCSQGELW